MAIDRLISTDSHIEIAHETVMKHLDPKHHEEYVGALKAFGKQFAESTMSQANGAWVAAEYDHPAKGRAGHSDPVERLKDMDTDGVDAEVLYCEVSAFRYLYMMPNAWREGTRAFNDALAAVADHDPKRLIVSYQIPIHDIDAAIEEVRRVVAFGAKSLQLPTGPSELGLPDYYHERYEPLFAEIQRLGIPICAHIGLNTNLDGIARRDPTPQRGVVVPLTAMMTAESLGMWIIGGVFERFPDLKVVFVEPGIGWVPWWLNTVDDMKNRQGYKYPAITKMPSEYFRSNVSLTFIDEPDVLHAAETLGIENLMWSTDYPHPVSTWPNSRASIERQLGHLPEEQQRLLVCGNAERIWNL
jgi:predicted TIM-barrel fold metal-dependent hydrolase